MKRSKFKCLSFILVLLFIFQITVASAAEYPLFNISSKPLIEAMSTKAGFGIYGYSNSTLTGVANGVIPSGMSVPQELKSGEWRYLGYNFDDKVISNPAFPGDYGGPGGTKIGGKASSWGILPSSDYSRITPATNADSGDTQSAKNIGYDYCDLIEPATIDKAGAFRVWFKIPPYAGYPNGRTMYMTYVIPKNDAINRYSFAYYRIDGTSTSLLSGGAVYEKNTYPLKLNQSINISQSAKDFTGYEFTRSITSTSSSGGFANEKTGELGKTRTGNLSYSSSNEFDVVFYYKPVVTSKTLKIKHVYYDPLTDNELNVFEEYSNVINKDGAITESAKTYTGYKFLKTQDSDSSYSTGTISTNSDFKFSFDNFGNANEHYLRFMYVKDNTNASLIGQIITDKSSYVCKSTDSNVAIQAKELTDLNIDDVSQVNEIGAKIISYSVNGGMDISVNKVKTSSGTKAIETDYATLNLNVSSLNDGINTINIKGYSWWKDKLGNLKEVSTSKSITVSKTASSKPIAVIDAPSSTHTGNTVLVKGSGSDPTGLSITEYSWTSSNGQVLTGTGGNIKVDANVTLSLKVKNSAGVWSDTVTHIISIENKPPTVNVYVAPTVYLGDDVYVSGNAEDKDGDTLEYFWDKPSDMNGNLEGKYGTVYFMSLGIKEFGLTVSDPSGEGAYGSAQTNVIAPTPQVNILVKGTLKENRKVILDGATSTGGSQRVALDWTKAKWEVSVISGGTATDIKTISSYNGTQTMDFVFKKPGTYKAKLTLTNTLGMSSSRETTFVIVEDKVPTAYFTLPQNISRDPEDPSSNGLAQSTSKITDLSKSEDGDTIVKRAYFVTFDSDNDGDFDEEICYVYDLNFNGTKQMHKNYSDNLHWRAIGLYKDFKTFNIDNINTGNFTEIEFKSTHVGINMFDIAVKEEFGQATIEQFITIEDKKKGDTY